MNDFVKVTRLQITCAIVLMVCICFALISGCGEQERPTTPDPDIELQDRLQVMTISVRTIHSYARACVLRDNFTGQEFLWVHNSDSNCVIPIGYDLGHIEKMKEESNE